MNHRYPRLMTAALIATALNLGMSTAPAQAQDFRERLSGTADGTVDINGEPVTYGFELEGRGPHVALVMRPLDAELNSRWDTMSDADKMAAFTAAGENIDRFKVDTEKFPWLSHRIHREYTGNWEIESEVFENMREALDRMREVKASMGPDSRGFHLHLRWKPEYDVYRANSAEITDWFSRAADAIYLRRLEVMKHTLSMNTNWNKRYDEATIASIEEAVRRGENRHEKARTIAWRPGGSGADRYLDVEIRGLWTRVNDIENVGRMLVHAFKNHRWGNAGLYDNFMPFEERVRGRTFAEIIAENARASGRELDAAEMKILENMSRHDSEWGTRVSGFMTGNFTKNMLTPFLGWENEASLGDETRRKVADLRKTFTKRILKIVDDVKAGEYGPTSNVNADAVIRKARYEVKRWARDARLADRMFRSLLPTAGNAESNPRLLEIGSMTGDNLREIGVREETIGIIEALRGEGRPVTAEALGSSNPDRERLLTETNIALSNENAENMPTGASYNPLRAETLGLESHIRETARNAFPSFHWMRDTGADRLNVIVTGETEPKVKARVSSSSRGSEIAISNGMLDKISAATEGMSEADAQDFRKRAITLLAIDALDKAVSLDLNVDAALRGASGNVSREEARGLRELYERAGIEVPREIDRIANGNSGNRTTGVIPEGLRVAELRRLRAVNDRARRARR